MRRREFMICAVVMSFGLVDVEANPPGHNDELKQPLKIGRNSVTSMRVPLPPPPSPLIEGDKVLGQAYYDTLAILSEDNSCSDFFGGTTGAVVVFNSFMSQVRKDYLARSIGMRMSGSVTTGLNHPTKTKYRLFDKVSLNADGPFYRKRISLSEPLIPRMGSFEPNTKEVRVLILLHELGHLMKGDDGNWLLPDDGKAEAQSRGNSDKIEEVCGDQIKGLTKAGSK
ncbi:MAG: hypothetical protein AABN95_03960 [Acidobacteriota bacterium]